MILTYVLCQEISCRLPFVSGFYCQLSLASRPLYNCAWHALLCITSAYCFDAAICCCCAWLVRYRSRECTMQFDNSGHVCLQGKRLCAKPSRQVRRPVKHSALRANARVKAWQWVMSRTLCKMLSCSLTRHACSCDKSWSAGYYRCECHLRLRSCCAAPRLQTALVTMGQQANSMGGSGCCMWVVSGRVQVVGFFGQSMEGF